MEIQASLHCIHLYSPQPFELAQFYSNAYGMSLTQEGGDYVCRGPGRVVAVTQGPANQLKYAHFNLHSPTAWAAFETRTQALPREVVPSSFAANAQVLAFRDPDGNLIVFTPAIESGDRSSTGSPSMAMLQHFALRTTQLPQMRSFYEHQVGFLLSDAVTDEAGDLRACFLRTDRLHHAMALFGAPAAGFDHQSFEVPSWDDMKKWGDHMAARKVPIVWGIGRHGPGNDVFFMVRDPDNNLVEISSEIENCAPGRPMGQWPHEERTLNLWGKAILRS